MALVFLGGWNWRGVSGGDSMKTARKHATAHKAAPKVVEAQTTSAERRHSVDRRVGTTERRIHNDRRLHLVPKRQTDIAPPALPEVVPALPPPELTPQVFAAPAPERSLQVMPAPAFRPAAQSNRGLIPAPVFKVAVGLGLAWLLFGDSPATAGKVRSTRAKSETSFRRVRD